MRYAMEFRLGVICALLLCFSHVVFATITLQGVNTTRSTCANNGTITVYATSTPNPFLLYSIVAGPVTAPIQNSSTFFSLYAGTYTIRIYDSNFDSIDAQATVAGNYQLPDLLPIDIDPTCSNSTDGIIIGNADSTKGLLPMRWEIISPFYQGPQPLDTFTNLSGGNYEIRMTDACNNYQTRTVVLNSQGTGIGPYGGIPTVYKIGCDTIVITHMFVLYKEAARLPITLTINTSNGPVTSQVYPEVVDTISSVPGVFLVTDTIVGLTYGSYAHVTLTDVCGSSTYSTLSQIAPFDFHYEYYAPGTGCSNQLMADVVINSHYLYPYYYTAMRSPVIMTVMDVASNTIVDRDTCPQNQYCSRLSISQQVGGRTYRITIVDGCGEIYQQNIVWPTPAPASVQVTPNGQGCRDSTSAAYFNCFNFMSGTTITIHSGPSAVHSSKPGYEHNSTINYPQVYTNRRAGGIALRDLAAGTYTYTVADSCGQSVSGTFTVNAADLTDFNYEYSIKRGCLGVNTLYFNAHQQSVALWVKNAAGSYIYQRSNYQSGLDSINSVVPGTYTLEIFYGNSPAGGGVFDTTLVPAYQTCWVLHDTITVYPYDNSTFKSNTTIFCNGVTYVELNVDSTKGVPPYQYEISSGPQTYPLQNGNTFQISAFGTYVIRIRDACGNSNIQQITIASDTFPPIVKKGIMCPNGKVVLEGISSAYFSYVWRRPNGSTFAGDSLIINPLTVADTGVYHVAKYVHINGCIDTFTASYHITFTDSFPQSIKLCNGDTLFVGNIAHTTNGRFIDTLRSTAGCDSIVITNLTLLNQTTTIKDTTICRGGQIVVNGHAYTLPGTYRDSIANGGCYQIIVTNLTVNGIADTVATTLCGGDTLYVGTHAYTIGGTYIDTLRSALSCDSIIVSNLTILQPTSAALFTICLGDSVVVAGRTYFTPGLHADTLLSASGCDSLVFTIINLLPQGRDTVNAQICAGGSYLFGGNTLTGTGTYYDTIATAGCDSIVMLNLSISNYLRDTIAGAICPSGSFGFHGNTFTMAGTYHDTLSGSGCDSIITLQLTQLDYLRDTVTQTICNGGSYNFHGTLYAAAGTYTDTMTVGAMCDQVSILNLSLAPYLRDTVIASICPGGGYLFHGKTYTTAGIYADTVTGPSCDSIITLILSITTYLKDTITATICPGRSYVYHNNSYGVAGTYVDTVTGPSCDTIVTLVLGTSPLIRSTINRSICSGQSITVGSHTYTQAGTYIDTLPTAGCDSIVTLNLTALSSLNTSLNRSICAGESITLGGQTYSQTGTYYDTVSSANGCESIITLNLTVNSMLNVTILANATEVYAGDTVQLNTTAFTVLNYNWTSVAQLNNPSIQTPWAIIEQPSWIYMQAAGNNNCISRDSVFINLITDTVDCNSSRLYVPNVFSPDGNGINDKFEVFGTNIRLIELLVFNRWGELVFHTKDINVMWDGSYKGVPMPPDVYVYQATYLNCDGTHEVYEKGSITLLK
ncbi:hypothetical protein BH09BAC1_BH09BAC1_01730 [soil metagenome]